MREKKFKSWDKEKKKWLKVKDLWNITDLNKIVLVQYIGLKDKNKRRIYEGDIVEQWTKDSEDDTHIVIGVVEYVAPKYCIKYKPKAYTSLINYGTNLEIIGNIYENPEYCRKYI